MEATPRETINIIENLLNLSTLTLAQLYNENFDTNYKILVDIINNYKDPKVTKSIKDLISSSDYFKGVITGADTIINKMVLFYYQVNPKTQSKVNLSTVFKAYLPSNIINDPYLTTCFWTLIYVYRFQKYTITELNRNSANCMFFIQDVIDSLEGSQKTLFVKLVDYESKYDDVLVDNINGFILSRDSVVLANGYKKHFLNYVDSFLSIKSENFWALSKLNNAAPDKSLMSLVQSKLPSKLPTDYKLAHVSIFGAINGISMDDILYKKNRLSFSNQNKEFTKFHLKVIREMYRCFRALETLGHSIGLVHNDLHFGNVFFDMDEHVVKLIDYGRMYIAKYEHHDDIGLTSFITREVMRNCCPDKYVSNKSTTYKFYMNDFPFLKSGYLGHYSDLITFVGNFYVYLTETRLFHDLKVNVDKYILEIKEDEDYGTTIFRPIVTLENLVQNYDLCFRNTLSSPIIQQHPYLDKIVILILDGLTLMVLAFINSKQEEWGNVFDPYFKFKELNDARNFMTFLETLDIPRDFTRNDSRLRYFKRTMRGGLICPPSGKKTRPNDDINSVDDDYEFMALMARMKSEVYFAESYGNTLSKHRKNNEQVYI